MTAQTIWNILISLYYLTLSIWIGGILFFSAIAAPAIHRSMASKAVAGEIVGKILKRFNYLELICCLTMILVLFSAMRFVPESTPNILALISILAVMGSLAFIYTFRIAPRMEDIKIATPTFYDLSKGHGTRKEFDQLHRLYVRLTSINLLLGLVVLYGSVTVLK